MSSIQPSPTTKEELNLPLPDNLWQLNHCLMTLFKVTDIYWSVFNIIPTGLDTLTALEDLNVLTETFSLH